MPAATVTTTVAVAYTANIGVTRRPRWSYRSKGTTKIHQATPGFPTPQSGGESPRVLPWAHQLDLLVRHKLTGSSDKATIAVSEVVFAGHVVGNGQRKPIPGRVAAIKHWEKPKTVSELRAYLGFCNYYSGYIKMYAEYAAPMTTMLKGNREETKKGSKKALVWNDESCAAIRSGFAPRGS